MTAWNNPLVEHVFWEYRGRIFGYIAGKNVPASDRDDVFSEVLLKVTRQAERYDSTKASVSTWVYVITRSIVADYFRKRKEEYPLSELLHSPENLTDCIEYKDELRELARQLSKLPEKERRIIILRLYKGMSYVEIAQSLGISETNASTIYSRAIGRLRKRMTNNF